MTDSYLCLSGSFERHFHLVVRDGSVLIRSCRFVSILLLDDELHPCLCPSVTLGILKLKCFDFVCLV